MKNKRMLWGVIILSSILILFIGYKAWGTHIASSAETLTKEEAIILIQDRYNGKVKEIKLEDNHYVMDLDKNHVNYELILDAGNGEVISFTKQGETARIPNVEEPEQEISEPAKSAVLTEKEIKQKLLKDIPGELLLFIKINEQGKDIYKVIIKGKEKKTILKVDGQTGEILLQKSEKESKVVITENEAISIALKQVKGKVNDVDLETDDYLNYYLVEIDTGDDREATIQIHAITGEILSITWDD